MLASFLRRLKGFKCSMLNVRAFSDLQPVYTRTTTVTQIDSFYSLPFAGQLDSLPTLPKPTIPAIQENDNNNTKLLDESRRSWVEVDWSVVDNEEFMLFMQSQYDAGGKQTIDVEKDGRAFLSTYGGNTKLLQDCPGGFIKPVFSKPGKNDILSNPFTWIYALIESCQKDDTLRIATFSDADPAAWLLIKDALSRGVKVKFMSDSMCKFNDDLPAFINNLIETYPGRFELKQQKPRKLGQKTTSQHDKIYLSNTWLITGSMNMSINARDCNSESGIVTNNEGLVSSFTTYFDDCIWENYSKKN